MTVAAGLMLFDQFAAYLVTFGIVDLGIDGNAAITSIATPICLGVLAAIAWIRSDCLKSLPELRQASGRRCYGLA